MAMLAGDAFGNRDALVFGLVREHRAAHDVSDRPHVGKVGPALGIDRDEAALVERESDGASGQTVRVRESPDRHDQAVEGCRLRRPGGVVEADNDFIGADLDPRDRNAGVDDQALPPEKLLRFARHRIVRGSEECRQRFEHGHLGAEPPPDAAHFEADNSRADDAEPRGHLGDRKRAGVVQNPHVVERNARERARLRARGDDDMLRNQHGRLRTVDPDGPAGRGIAAGKRANAVEEGHLVLLEQIQDAVVVLGDDLFLAREHAADIDRESLDLDAVIGERMARMLVVLGRLQQRLRGDAPDVGAGAARGGLAALAHPVVDARRLHSQLRAADRRDVATRAGADDDDVELLGHRSLGRPTGPAASAPDPPALP